MRFCTSHRLSADALHLVLGPHFELQALEQWFRNISCNQNHQEVSMKHKLQDPPPEWLIQWVWGPEGPRICILYKFQVV